MIRRVALLSCALALLVATGASAQAVYTGTVVRVDQPASVVVLSDGRMYLTAPQTMILVNNQPVGFATLQPGTVVTLREAQPVLYQDGRYVVMTEPRAVVAVPAPAAVVVQTPQAVVPPPRMVTGVVRKVDWPAAVILMDDGRVIHLDPYTVVLIDNQMTDIRAIRPGQRIVVQAPGSVLIGGAALPWSLTNPDQNYLGDRGTAPMAP